MIRYLLAVIILFSLVACNLGVAQQIDDDATIIQSTTTPLITQAFRDNDVPLELILNVQHIYERGQELGNRANVFSKVGDSLTVSHNFLYPFGVGRYNLGEYIHLETIVTNYVQANAHIGNSFINESLAAREGWSASAVLSPESADATFCRAGESPLFCEYRIVRPTIAIIMFGTNDSGYRTEAQFTQDMQTIITFTSELGIIPILSTIPNRPDVERQVLLFNDVIRQLTAENHIPLIELYYQTVNLPNYGLTSDNVHLSSPPTGLTDTATFNAVNLQYGYVVRNLATLETINIVQNIIND